MYLCSLYQSSTVMISGEKTSAHANLSLSTVVYLPAVMIYHTFLSIHHYLPSASMIPTECCVCDLAQHACEIDGLETIQTFHTQWMKGYDGCIFGVRQIYAHTKCIVVYARIFILLSLQGFFLLPFCFLYRMEVIKGRWISATTGNSILFIFCRGSGST